MQYLLLIYSAEDAGPQPGDSDFGQLLNDFFQFTQDVQDQGVFEAGQALENSSTATTVRIRNGKTEISDGPFAETKEVLGGFYILDCKDLDEALSYAAKIPTADHGVIEVRPVMVFD